MVHVAQIEAVHLCRHARRVRIPVQKVERGRLAAHQIVVHDKEPDQIVFAQEVECLRHVATFKITEAIHVLVGKLELGIVDKYRDVADIGKVEQAS